MDERRSMRAVAQEVLDGSAGQADKAGRPAQA
jgi:hypothetical protein